MSALATAGIKPDPIVNSVSPRVIWENPKPNR